MKTRRRLALAAAALTSATGLLMAGASALERGGSVLDRVLIAAISCMLVLGAHLLPTLSRSMPARALWIGCLLLTAWSHAAFFAAAAQRAGSARADSVTTSAQARALQTELEAIAARPLAQVSADLAAAQARVISADLALQRCRKALPEAASASPTACARPLEAVGGASRQVEALAVEEDEARRAAALRQRLVEAAGREDLARDQAAVDPVTAMLSTLLGLKAGSAGVAVAVLSAVVVELLAALLWTLGLRSGEEELKAITLEQQQAQVVPIEPPPQTEPVRPEPAPLGPPVPILALDALQDPTRAELMALAAPVAVRPRAEAALLRDTILRLCSGRSLGLQVLAQLLQREPDHLRRRTLAAMVRQGLLRADPCSPLDPRLVYSSAGPVLTS